MLKINNKNLADQLMGSMLLAKTDMLLGLSTDLIMPLKLLIGSARDGVKPFCSCTRN